MKNTTVNNKMVFTVMNVLMAVSAAFAAYGFCISNEKGSGWVTWGLLKSIFAGKSMLTDKAEKTGLAAGGAAALITAAAVISKVGFYIMNIRYAAIVFMAAVAVYAAVRAAAAMTGKVKAEA